MLELLVGLVVFVLMGVAALLGVLLFPLLLLLGLFLRLLVAVFLVLFMIWVVGKATLLAIESFNKPKDR